MDKVRAAVIGVGGMGEHHCRTYPGIEGIELTAVCDIDPERLKLISERYEVPGFGDYREILEKDLCDAVVIATPHYDHPPIAIDSFRKGKHVLCEKPVGVYTQQAAEADAEHAKHPDLVYAIMFQLRAAGIYKKVKDLVESGELGPLTRVIWINTDWYRTQAYYDSGGWRATWSGEGGGVLLNQCPHSLDLLQWLTGMPNRVRAFCSLGKMHHIEVEDDVTAYLEYENGATGVFITTTGEAPGTSRQEIAGTQGKVVLENGKITFSRNRVPCDEFTRTSEEGFSLPEVWTMEIPPAKGEGRHEEITENFVAAVLKGEAPIAAGEEGIRSLALGNAMVMSGLKDKWVDIPFDDAEYKELIEELCEKSTFKKTVKKIDDVDMEDSFHK